MASLREQMIKVLQLNGKAERAQQACVREVRLLSKFYRKSPELISGDELQNYFLHRSYRRRQSFFDLSCSLRFQSGHWREQNRQRPEPDGHFQISRTGQQTVSNHIPGCDGVHPSIPAARPAHRLHEGPPLRLHERHLPNEQ